MRQNRPDCAAVTQALFTQYGEVLFNNATQVSERDIAIATFAGAGKAIIAIILRELGLDYIDALTETLRPDGRHPLVAADADYRDRLGNIGTIAVADPARPRVMKTNLPIGYFRDRPLHGLWILIRDPRDSLYSTYRLAADVLPHLLREDMDSFANWLTSDYFAGLTPIDTWTGVYAGWPEATGDFPRLAVTRFEDLKREPHSAISAAFAAFGLEVAPSDLDRAIEMSSFDRMRAHEDAVMQSSGRIGDPGRIMRRGKIDEWREWMTPNLERLFADEALVATAARYGYDVAS